MTANQSALFAFNKIAPVDIILKECNHHLVDKLIATNHYSKKVTSNRWRSFAVYYNGILSGGLQIGYGIRPEMKTHIIENATSESVKEFDRMWLSDIMPKNSESRVIGMLIKYLRHNYPELKVLISYADGIRGNIGTIYQATNFIYIGEVAGEFYFIPSKNEWVHPVSMYHRHGTRANKALKDIYPDIKHIRGPQYRYVYFINRGWRNKLKIPSVKYPKLKVSD